MAFRPRVFLLTLVLIASACQRGYGVGVLNACSTPVEVDITDVKPDAGGAVASWVVVDPGAQRDTSHVADVEYIYVRVRAEGETDVHTLRLALDEIPSAPAPVDYDLQVTLEGPRCPESHDTPATSGVAPHNEPNGYSDLPNVYGAKAIGPTL